MANEFKYANDTGDTYYVRLFDGTAQLWNTSSETFEAWAAGNVADYDIALTDKSSGVYYGDMPGAIITAGTYYPVVYKQSGGTPAVGDKVASNIETIQWDGTNEIAPDLAVDWTEAEKAQIRYMIGLDGSATKPSTNKQHIVKAIRTRRRW